jgi:hypothetical protein
MASSRFRRTALAGAVIVLVAAAGGLLWLRHAPRKTPAGQPPLATLDTASLEDLRAAFNLHSGKTRVLALLSPT